MANMEVLFPKEVNVSDIKYSEVPQPLGGDKSQAKIVYVNIKEDKQVCLQTPLMKCPYGISSFDAGDGDRIKYSLDLSLGGDSKSLKELNKLLEDIDEKVLKDSSKNSLAWFKKKSQSRDVSAALFTPSIKIATDNGEPTDKYPNTFKVKIPFYDGKFKVKCYNDSKEPITDDLTSVLGKGQRVRAIVKLSGIWIAGGKFGMKWDLVQLKMTPQTKIETYAFEDSDEEDSDGNAVPPPPPPVADGGGDYVLDSEDEL